MDDETTDAEHDERMDERAEEQEEQPTRHRCAGFSSPFGPCGSPDCDGCYPW